MDQQNTRAILRIDQQVQSKPCLQQMIAAEPAIMELFALAAKQENGGERWRMYEVLKREGSHYVGWDAQQPELSSSAMYQAFVEALDELLPAPLDETA